MKCPNCGVIVKSSQQVWQERMRALGRCIECAVEKSEKDMPHARCRRCRLKGCERNKRAYRRRHHDDALSE